MNWFTREFVASLSLPKKKELLKEHDGCAHVVANPESMVVVNYENDTWGREGYCICRSCHEASEKERLDQPQSCWDCGQTFKLGELLIWKPYDFNPREGDRYLHICKECQSQPKHLNRVKRDREDMELELGDTSYTDYDFD